MKIVVQNGCNHALSRKEMESIIPLFPSRWSNKVKSITLCQGDDSIEVEFHEKEMILDFFSPEDKTGSLKNSAIEEILISLSCISSEKKPPNHLSRSEREHYFFETENVREKCQNVISK